MSPSSNCFGLMIEFWCDTDSMSLWTPVVYSIACVLEIARIKSISAHCRLVIIVCSNRQVILAKIVSTLNARNTRHIFNRSVQHSLTSIEYRSRRSSRVFQLTPWFWTQCFTWTEDITTWTLRHWQHLVWSDESLVSCWFWNLWNMTFPDLIFFFFFPYKISHELVKTKKYSCFILLEILHFHLIF